MFRRKHNVVSRGRQIGVFLLKCENRTVFVFPRWFLFDELAASVGHSGDSAYSFFLSPYHYRLRFGHTVNDTVFLLRLEGYFNRNDSQPFMQLRPVPPGTAI